LPPGIDIGLDADISAAMANGIVAGNATRARANRRARTGERRVGMFERQ
jgi:hypothetical protein